MCDFINRWHLTKKLQKLLGGDDFTAFGKCQLATKQEDVHDAQERTWTVLVLSYDPDPARSFVAGSAAIGRRQSPTDPLNVIDGVAFGRIHSWRKIVPF